MKKLIFAIGLIFVLFASSCLSNKQVVYFQDKGTLVDSRAVTALSKPYRVQINDILNISVKALDPGLVSIFNPVGENISGSGAQRSYLSGFTVDDHGSIEFPILGKISVLGYTVKEIEDIVKSKLLEQYFKETAQLFVTVKLAGFRFTVLGEVGGTGTKTLFQDRVNIIEAVANSGDIKSTGNRKDVLIIREYPGGHKIHHIDLTDIAAFKSPYFYIQPNDMIIVKPLKRRVWGAGETVTENLGRIVSVFSVLVSTYFLVKNL